MGHTRRLRWQEVQNLKNNRIAGESRAGYLELRPPLPSSWAGLEEYVNSIVEAENNDRQLIYAQQSRAENRPLEQVEKAAAGRLRVSANRGEWIQAEDGIWTAKGE